MEHSFKIKSLCNYSY